MRRLFRFILLRPVLWAVNKFSSRPDRQRIFKALSKLYYSILHHPGKKGLLIPFEEHTGKFIVFSDQHKGSRNGADDFKEAEPNYLAALDHYSANNFCFINLGDCEELWENNITQVQKHNQAEFEAEKNFIVQKNYVKIYGNHDLYWNTSLLASWHLKTMYGEKIKVYEGVILQTVINNQRASAPGTGSLTDLPATTGTPLTIFLTHGHQGDAQSDGNRFSKFFIASIWAPLQAFLRINPNTPAYNSEKKTLHNSIMYDWSSKRKNTLLVTGHTHQPVFGSLTNLEKLYKKYQLAGQRNDQNQLKDLEDDIRKIEKKFTPPSMNYLATKPSYFNSGCCCFSDGDITGIEIADGCIRLIKWSLVNKRSVRFVLDETALGELVTAI